MYHLKDVVTKQCTNLQKKLRTSDFPYLSLNARGTPIITLKLSGSMFTNILRNLKRSKGRCNIKSRTIKGKTPTFKKKKQNPFLKDCDKLFV
jgi:hypothetical protein